MDGGCYKSILTVKNFEPFPDWSDPKRICPYVYCESRNRLVKSTICLYPQYCNMIFRQSLTSNSIQGAPGHVPDILEHLLLTPDRLNTSDLEYLPLSHNLLAQIIKIMFFGEIKIKRNGGCYKLILTSNFCEPFPD